MSTIVTLKAVRQLRSYEQIVNQLRDAIMDGTFARGEKLPTERELGGMFGVSRSVVREAVRVLDALGFVESRQGSGLYVRHDFIPAVVQALTLSTPLDDNSFDHLLELWKIIELAVVRLAALSRTPEQTTIITARACAAHEIAPTAETTDDIAAFFAADDRFHEAIYDAVDNPYLVVLSRAVREMTRGALPQSLIITPEFTTIISQQHLRIAAAISTGRADESMLAMSEHIVSVSGQISKAAGRSRSHLVSTEGGQNRSH